MTIIEAAKERLANGGQRTVLFLDEIHRFNRAQQDAFLPYVERGDIVLLGALSIVVDDGELELRVDIAGSSLPAHIKQRLATLAGGTGAHHRHQWCASPCGGGESSGNIFTSSICSSIVPISVWASHS